MADDNSHNATSLIPKLIILLIAVACAALVVALYHCIRVGWCTEYQQRQSPPQRRRRAFHFNTVDTPSSIEHSIAELIPVRKYSKSDLELEGENDHTCAICLCEFEEGDELRTLPECAHSFHAPCIDMWFYSHTSCPICRADATPSPLVLMHFIETDMERPAATRP